MNLPADPVTPMSEDHLTDREILLLVRRDVQALLSSNASHEKRLGVLERSLAAAYGMTVLASAVMGWMKIKVSLKP